MTWPERGLPCRQAPEERISRADGLARHSLIPSRVRCRLEGVSRAAGDKFAGPSITPPPRTTTASRFAGRLAASRAG
ncbi:MAG: hypothetical protein JRC92_09330 [Deltaproteobacteria bacterium]|nr:hypothetical protein [Deltaproteobacteria bacterium]